MPINGSNYMDYNLDCNKMFTNGQVERMTAALNLPERSPLWSTENSIQTGCAATSNCGGLEVSFSGLPNTIPIINSVTLTGTPAGGTFSGSGVIFDVFNANLLLPGLHTVSYNYTDAEGCTGIHSQSVLVYTVNFTFVDYNMDIIEPKMPQFVEVQLEVHQAQQYTIQIYDVNGKPVHRSQSYFDSGNYTQRFQTNCPLNKGLYLMRVASNNYSVTHKWIQ